MVRELQQKTPISVKVAVGLLLLMVSFLLGQVLPDRIGLEGTAAALRTEVAQLKQDAQQFVRRGEFEQFSRGLDQRLQAIEKALEKIDRKLDR